MAPIIVLFLLAIGSPSIARAGIILADSWANCQADSNSGSDLGEFDASCSVGGDDPSSLVSAWAVVEELGPLSGRALATVFSMGSASGTAGFSLTYHGRLVAVGGKGTAEYLVPLLGSGFDGRRECQSVINGQVVMGCSPAVVAVTFGEAFDVVMTVSASTYGSLGNGGIQTVEWDLGAAMLSQDGRPLQDAYIESVPELSSGGLLSFGIGFLALISLFAADSVPEVFRADRLR